MNNNQDMTTREIVSLCEAKQSQLISKYFGNLVHEAAIERPETIGEYTKDLPLKIEAEFRTFLEDLLARTYSRRTQRHSLNTRRAATP